MAADVEVSNGLPPWAPAKFDVKKKPPAVPKPRYARGGAFASPTPSPAGSCVGLHVAQATPTSATVSAEVRPILPVDRPRWGQLGGDDASKARETVHDLPLPVAEPIAAAPASEVSYKGCSAAPDSVQPQPSPVAARGADYDSNWQRWRAMPSALEEKRQQFLRPKSPGPAPPHVPSKEALAFFEQLLAGTEPEPAPSTISSPAAPVAKTESTARVVDGAERLRQQAEAARQRRKHAQLEAARSNPRRTSSNSATETLKAEPKQDSAAAAEKAVHAERQMQERQEEHARLMKEMELESERERERLTKEMRKDQAERESRRKAQDEWKDQLKRKTEQQKREAEQQAETRQRQQEQADEAWRKRWWKEWQKTEERSRQKDEDQKKWSEQWWEQWRHEEEEKDGGGFPDCPDESGDLPRVPAPPAEARTDDPRCMQVFAELHLKRREALEDRKGFWRKLCLQWHPDKCEDKDLATVMFQYLQGLKTWFLGTTP